MIAPNANVAAQLFLQPVLGTATCVVDATAGNGYDTLFLAEKTAESCRIWAFDIQEQAIGSARSRTASIKHDDRICWVNVDHACMNEFVFEPVDAAMFNLGYLPGSSRSIVTQPSSLEPALNWLLQRLKPLGRISIVAYPGHQSGQEEILFLEQYLAQLPQQRFIANRLQYLNQKNQPAILYTIGKIGRNFDEDPSADKSKGTGRKKSDPYAG